ncbi:MAG TPA: DUF1501 domain-containing protein [Bryobacteraceae bacterium]|nr:DUF1501 domain-containing protein [Bryobacteraceae bacterium]
MNANEKNRDPNRIAPSRRELLRTASTGFGYLALSALMADPAYGGTPASRVPHFPPKAKNVIFLFMPGGVSHMDTFDPKPKLADLDGKVSTGNRKWLKCPWKFKTYGQMGLPVSELFPELSTIVDDLTVVRSMKSEFPLHARANVFLHTGRNISGFPSIGSWVTYGLGSENKNLPGYLLLNDGDTPPGGMENFSNGFLPASYQAMGVRAEGVAVDNITPGDSDEIQRLKMQVLAGQDKAFLASVDHEQAVEASIANFEMAYRMQSLAPDVLSLDKETESIKKLYGLDAQNPHKRLYGLQCLRARRLVEAGVRFVEVTCPLVMKTNGTWDQHTDLKKGHETNAMVTDQAVTGLIKDLKARGLLKDTLVLWAGEFGRTPDTSNGDGRDHHTQGFTIWMAGGGAKPGTLYGATDDIGKEAIENVVTVHDLHATVLQLLGIDHTRLTYRYGGRDVTLPDVHGQVVKQLIA